MSADEALLIVHYDAAGRALGETRCAGGPGHVAVPLRTLLVDALRWQTCVLVLMHSHPGAPPRPSPADLATTRRIGTVAAELGLRVHDHVIHGKGGAFSFRAHGLL